MLGHLWIPQQLLQQRQVALAPRLQTHRVLVGSATLGRISCLHFRLLSSASRWSRNKCRQMLAVGIPSFSIRILVHYESFSLHSITQTLPTKSVRASHSL